MTKPKNHLPKFKSEDEERAHWATRSPLDYFDTATVGRSSFPNLKPSLKSISIRLPGIHAGQPEAAGEQAGRPLPEPGQDLFGPGNKPSLVIGQVTASDCR